MNDKPGQPFIQHTVDRASGLQELWLCRIGKDGFTEVIAGPEPLPKGWAELFNKARMEAL
jgi:hypothetical protein